MTSVFGQKNIFPFDTLTTEKDAKLSGEYVRLTPDFIYFKFEGNTSISRLPKEKIKHVALSTRYTVDLTTGALSDKKEKEYIAYKTKKSCELNKKIKIIVFPFSDDKYGRTDQFIINLQRQCFTIVEDYFAFEYLKEQKISYSDITSYDIIKMGVALGVDRVAFGDLYLINREFMYVPNAVTQPVGLANTREASGESLNDLLNAFQAFMGEASMNQANEMNARIGSKATEVAGTYLYETSYYVDISKNEKKYININQSVLKW